MRRTVQVRAERHAFFVNLAQSGETENLKPARVRKDGPIPRHEPMQPAHPANRLDARPQKKMVGIREQNLDAQLFKHILRDALHRSQRSHRHKHRRLDLSVRSNELAGAGGTAGGFNLQADGHGGIVTELSSKSSPPWELLCVDLPCDPCAPPVVKVWFFVPLQSAFYFAYRFLTPSPPFITNLTRSRVVTSASGSPSTATMSAHFPASIVPILSDQPSRSASLIVAVWIACSGVKPSFTITANSCALSPCGYTAASVPKPTFTPAANARATFLRAAGITSRPFAISSGGVPIFSAFPRNQSAR